MRRTALLPVVLFALLAGCASAAEPRPLTTTEAEQLAMVRFTNYSQQTADLTTTVPAPGGRLRLTGRVDFVNHVGYASLETEGRSDQDSTGLVLWNLTTVAFHPGPAGQLNEPPPPDSWQVRELRENGSELDGALRLMLNLAADRPDNAQLLAQSSARWLRADSIGAVSVAVLEGPQQAGQAPSAQPGDARLRYWLDAEGRLHRVEARLGNQQEFAVIDFTGPGGPMPTVPGVPLPGQ
ncbi:hypothetical protein [Goodfellowiella coeruleoviolacea]|uniref:LppX_LprAFG lipoprotein n=1 Tax=Goodfellowiella coeruleoviolacea TaxID=334858 RepID=A0AAE3GDV0_9PSEU|nr:hypothetical protein [Goodfellowiella coeruleoviolacea]MCP2164308.1 hypothetical protein [Goodfellowiella coeruleoviolacea]